MDKTICIAALITLVALYELSQVKARRRYRDNLKSAVASSQALGRAAKDGTLRPRKVGA